MPQTNQDLLKQAYSAFNSRDFEAVLSIMHEDVLWPNIFGGGYLLGREAIKEYWVRQFLEFDATSEPVAFSENSDGQMEVVVHQIIKDLKGNVLFGGNIKHIYTIEGGLIKNMDVERL